MPEAVTAEDFAIWRADPVTRWIFAGITRAQEQERAEWMRRSWDSAPPDGRTDGWRLVELRTRHDALGELAENDFDTWKDWNEREPERH